jgi:prepilin-type N-terminal cleavage/methylation domain-containing protein
VPQKNTRGFTLIELLVVVAIMAVLMCGGVSMNFVVSGTVYSIIGSEFG